MLSNVVIGAYTNTRIWRIQTWGNERNFLNCFEQPVLFIALFLWTEGKVSWEQLAYDRILLVPYPASASRLQCDHTCFWAFQPVPKNHVLNMLKTEGNNIKATGRMPNVAWISSCRRFCLRVCRNFDLHGLTRRNSHLGVLGPCATSQIQKPFCLYAQFLEPVHAQHELAKVTAL